jgi:transcriptional regulator with XRE-family HTH domain
MDMAAHCSGNLNQSQPLPVRFSRNAFRAPVRYYPIMLDWHLKDWLKSLRVSQAELCRRTDYPKAKVSDLVTGKQRYNRDILNDIAAALHLEPYELLMDPATAMAQRRFRKAAQELVEVPVLGVTTDIDEPESRTGTRG